MEPLVSICCQTYNHKDYIRTAIESFLMQKTSFSYEILLRDDASTDGTTEIVKEYANKYPELIKPLIYDENQFIKGVKPFADNVKRAKGKYIAICEGDDYWTDPLKLQKQVDFLEANPEYGLVHTDNSNYYQATGKIVSSHKKKYYPNPPSGFVFNDLIKKNFITTLTVVVKKDLVLNAYRKLNEIMNQDLIFDYALWLEISRNTKIQYLKNITAVYRISLNTASRPGTKQASFLWKKKIEKIQDFFASYYKIDADIIETINYNRVFQRLRLQYRKSEYANYVETIDSYSFFPDNLKDRLLLFLYKHHAKRFWYLILESPAALLRKISKLISK